MRSGGRKVEQQAPWLRPLLGVLALSLALAGCAPADTSIWTNPAVTTHAWGLLGSAGFSSTTVYTTSLAFDRGGTPYVVFEDGAFGGNATVMKLAGGNWVPVGLPGFSPNQVQFDSIAIDSTGTPYVGYMDLSSTKANVMKYTGAGATGWQAVGPADFSTSQITEIAFAIGKNDVPFVAYVDTSGNVVVEKFTSPSWTQVGSSSPFSVGATRVSLAVDSNGFPWVAYAEPGSLMATVMQYDGSVWNVVGPSRGSASTGSALSTSIALDANDVPYVACPDTAYADRAAVKKLVSGSWVDVGTPGFSANAPAVPSGISLSIGTDGAPYVAYQDGPTGGVTVMMFAGIWTTVGKPQFSVGQAQVVSLALDPVGAPYVAFADGTMGNRPTVMAYK
jgi:hypothetical protein